MKKKCTKCGKVKDTSEFHKNSRNKDGLRYDCKQCRHEHNIVSREIISKQNKEYRKKNRKSLSIRRKKDYQLHKEKVLKREKKVK